MNNETEQKPKLKRGRPKGGNKYKPGKVALDTSYLSSHPEQLLAFMKAGHLDYEIYAAFNICKDTFYEWLRTHADFKKAYDIGLCHCQAFYLRHAREAMLRGDDNGSKHFIMIMNNKFGWGKDENNKVTNNTQINIQGNMQVLNSKSPTELLELLKSNINYLKTNNVIDVTQLEHITDVERSNTEPGSHQD